MFTAKNNLWSSLLKYILFFALAVIFVGSIVPQAAQAEPWWQVYFTPGDGDFDLNSDFELQLKSFMDAANQELLISSYTWGTSTSNEVIIEANEADNAGLDVKIIADGDEEKNPNLNSSIPYHQDPAGNPIMHSKFIIRDPGTENEGLMVSTNNFTEGGFSSQPGMMVIFENFPQLINSYVQEFTERFNGTWNGGSSTTNNLTAPTGELVESLFAPEDLPLNTNLANRISNAEHSVFFMALLQTNSNLRDAGITAKNNGAVVEGVYDDMYSDIKSGYLSNNIDVREDLPAGFEDWQYIHHHKTYIIDMEMVAFGSSNHTQSANDYNDESMVIVHDPALARKVVREFQHYFENSDIDPDLSGTTTHDDIAPGPASELNAQPTATKDKSLTLNWTTSPPSDFNRYYIFIDTEPITGGEITKLRPEIATVTDPAQNSVEINSINDGEPLEIGRDYYVGISLVDHHGNESTVLTAGPVAPQPASPHANPEGVISFAPGFSKKASFNSQLELEISNDSSAEENIMDVTVDFQTGSDAFEVLLSQPTPPVDWQVKRIDGSQIEFIAANGGVAPGDSQVFDIAVGNPTVSGSSAKITAKFVDSNGFEQTKDLGSLEIEAPGALVASGLVYSDTEDRAGKISSLNLSVKNFDTSPTDVQKLLLDFGNNSDHSFYVQSLDQQNPHPEWTAVNRTERTLEFTADNSSAEIVPGEELQFSINVYNPRASGSSETATLTVFDNALPANVTSDTPGQLEVLASPDIVFNEIMYHPAGSDEDLEWVEIANRNVHSGIQLQNWTVTVAGDTYTFGDQIIDAGGFIMLANDLNDDDGDGLSFSDSFPDVTSPAKDMDFLLGNTTGALQLGSSDGTYQTAVTYDEASWGSGASGTGKTFEKVDKSIDDTNNPAVDASNWQVSGITGGTPGENNSSGLISLETISVSDGTNTIQTLDGTQKLQLAPYTIDVTLDRPTADSPVIYWDAENAPDGEGGSETDEKLYYVPDGDGDASTYRFVIDVPDPELTHGSVPELLVVMGNQTFDNNGNFYKWEIDDQISAPTNLADSEVLISAVGLTWNTIADPDFSEYRIYYSTSSPVTTGDQYQSQSENRGGLSVTGLDENTTYYFNITAVDEGGNESVIASEQEISVTTGQGFSVEVDNVTDGVNSITILDGSEVLREENYKVNFRVSPAIVSNDLRVFYDVSDTPDGTEGPNENDREASISGNENTWEATIPASDPEIVGGAEVKFVIQTRSQLHNNSGATFKYQVDAGVEQKITGFQASDTRGGEVDFEWDKADPLADFKTYRIYYTPASDSVSMGDPYWDFNHDPDMSDLPTGQTTLTGLNPGSSYKFKIALVDANGNVGPLSSEVRVTTNLKGTLIITEFAVDGNNMDIGHDWVEIYALEGPVDLSNLILSDLSGLPDDRVASAKTTLRAGEYAVWHDTAPPDETDAQGDINGNGHIDLYDNNTDVADLSKSSNGVLVLKDANTGDTIDAVVFRANLNQDIDTQLVSDHLVPDHWVSADSTQAVTTFTGLAVDYIPVAVRKLGLNGKLLDNNRGKDWEVSTNPSRGSFNNYLRISEVKMGDTLSKERYDFKKEITLFDGSEFLKDSSEEIFSARLNQQPVRADDLQFWYSRVGSPTGRAIAESDSNVRYNLENNYDTATRTIYIADNFVTSVSHDSTVRFFVSSENEANLDSPLGEIKLLNADMLFKYKIDDWAPYTPSDVKVSWQDAGQVKLSWNPPAQEDDFLGYRVLYDTQSRLPIDQAAQKQDWREDPNLSNPSTSSTFLALEGGDTYYFRVGAVDKHGNRSSINNLTYSEYSDTIAVFVYEPVKLESILATEDTNSFERASLIEQKAYFRSDSVSVTVEFDRAVDSPGIVWNRAGNGVPDKNGDTFVSLTSIGANSYQAQLPAQATGTEIRFRLYSASGGYIPSSPNMYGYTVDDTASLQIEDFSLGAVDVQSTNMFLNWKPLSRFDVDDFQEYRIYYNKGLSVSMSDSYYGKAKDANMSDSPLGGAVVSGLDPDDTYTFAVIWVDKAGNISPMPKPAVVTAKTYNAIPFEDPATDGINIAHVLDGSEYLRDTDITITFEFSSPPLDQDNVRLYYRANGTPTTGDASISMREGSAGNVLIYEGTISGDDPAIQDGNTVNYFLLADGREWTNSGNSFKFNIDDIRPQKISGLSVLDYGDYLKVSWDPVLMDDFRGYRIRYKEFGAETWNFFDKDNNSDLGNRGTSATYISGLSSTANYCFNITAVDKVQYTNWRTGDYILQRTETGTAPALTTDQQVWVVSPGDTVLLPVLLTDIGGNPWGGQPVNYSMVSSEGTLGSEAASALSLSTSADGTASAVFNTSPLLQSYYYTVVVSHPDAKKSLEFVIYTPSEEKDGSEVRSVPFSK